MREAFLDALPPDVPGRIGELSDYRFVDPEAQAAFDELMEHIREQVMGAYFRSMAEGLRSMSPEDLARFRDMLAELNQMIEQRERGEPYDFEGFMQRHGDFFPGNPKTLDELLEQMAARMAAMSRLLASMSPEERAELRALAEQVLQDMDLAFEVDRLGSNLSSAFPDLGWGEPALAGGDEPMPLSATIDAMERLHDLEELDRSLQGDYPGASIDDVDEDALRQALGEDAVRDLRRLKEIERALERAGLVSRERGRLEVTPKGARSMGERALVRVFEQLRRDREGVHEAREAGGLAEPTGATRPWRFGDAGQIAVQRSVFNAVVRGGPGARVRLEPDDLELLEAEQRTEAATALLLDLSFSMPLRGHDVHAKRMALALHALIEGRYPHDTLYLIGFSDYARQMQPRELAAAGLGARVRDEHAPRVPPRRPAARAAPARDAAGDHGDRRRADRAPRGRARALRLAADPQDDPPDARRGDQALEIRRDPQRVHARGLARADRLHGAPGRAHGGAGLPDGRPRARVVRAPGLRPPASVLARSRRAARHVAGRSHHIVTIGCSTGPRGPEPVPFHQPLAERLRDLGVAIRRAGRGGAG